MKQLFVPYELAVKLKEKGFNEPCLGIYITTESDAGQFEWFKRVITNLECEDAGNRLGQQYCVSAPLYQQILDWFRTKYNMHINVYSQADSVSYEANKFSPNGKYSGTIDDVTIGKEMVASDTICLIPTGNSYYETLNGAIEQALENM